MKNNFRYFLYRLKLRMQSLSGYLVKWLAGLPLLPVKKRLLIVKLDSIGDYILFRDFLPEIARSARFRDFEITLCGNSWWKDLSESLDGAYVHHFIWVDYARIDDAGYQAALCSELAKKRFLCAVTPTHSRSRHTDILVLGSGARHRVAPEGDSVNIHAEEKRKNDRRYSQLIRTSDPLAFEFERNRSFFSQFLQTEISVRKPALSSANEKRKRVALCPGAKSLKRQWSPENFYKLSVYLKSRLPDYEFHICASASESPIAEAIMRSGNEVVFTDHSGKQSLLQLKHFLSGASLVVCNDSAPYHMAAALDVPLICLSNGNHYQRFCPYPGNYNKTHLEFFPGSLLAGLSAKKITELQLSGSGYDINEITPGQVIHQLEQTRFLNDIIDNNR